MPDNFPFEPLEVSRRLLVWYGRVGRDLPWRRTHDPYRIWLSEIMLQQTTVAAVIPYYERFLERFPTVEALALASLDDVITLWAGLGYYSRARNLHRAARQVVADFEGAFPDSLEGLTALPGIGRSTAGAILSIAFDTPAPILDGNVRRVLVRLFAWDQDPRSSRAEKQLWAWAEALTSKHHPHDYAQAIMDLGATVCLPRTPLCDDCPLLKLCRAAAEGLAGQLPVKRIAKPVPTRHQAALLICRDGRLLLRQRPPEGLLGGLWEFPLVDLAHNQDPAMIASRQLRDFGFSGALSLLGVIHHAYSHFKLELTVFVVSPESGSLVAENDMRWCDDAELASLPLHGSQLKAYALFPQKL